jgi:hypothetical protein
VQVKSLPHGHVHKKCQGIHARTGVCALIVDALEQSTAVSIAAFDKARYDFK